MSCPDLSEEECSLSRLNLMHDNSHEDSNLMQVDQMHVEDGPNLVNYFEKLVRDEVSACNSAHDFSDPKLMQTDQFNIGGTLEDCIDFDAQSLSDQGTFDVLRDPSHLGLFANSSDQTVYSAHLQGASCPHS